MYDFFFPSLLSLFPSNFLSLFIPLNKKILVGQKFRNLIIKNVEMKFFINSQGSKSKSFFFRPSLASLIFNNDQYASMQSVRETFCVPSLFSTRLCNFYEESFLVLVLNRWLQSKQIEGQKKSEELLLKNKWTPGTHWTSQIDDDSCERILTVDLLFFFFPFWNDLLMSGCYWNDSETS